MDEPSKRFDFKTFLNLHRALFAKWSFFERAGDHLRLECKAVNQLEWRVLDTSIKTSSLDLFFNPQGTLNWALQSLIERFVRELQSEDSAQAVSLEMLKAWVGHQAQGLESWHFRVIATRDHQEFEIFQSEPFAGRPL